MTKFITAFFMLLLAANISFGQNNWYYVSNIPVVAQINSISVVNVGTIWVCCDGGRVYKSVNGGVSWLTRSTGLGTANLYGISALDTTTCWVGTATGSIFKTSDGGMTWTNQLTQSASFSNGIKMFNANYGMFYGDPTGNGQPYQFRITTNGGTNWNLSPTAPIATNEFGVINAWDWMDSSRVWIGSANTTANATTCKIYRTTTGFYTGPWLNSVVTGTGGSAGLYYQAVAFTDANNGMSGSNGANIVKTTDGGLTWTTAPLPPGQTNFAAINMNALKDGSNTIRLSLSDGTSNYMFKTTNLGTSWTQETLPSQASLDGIQHMQFLNAALGYGGGLGEFFRYGPATGIENGNNGVASNYSLKQNYPNPFNPSTMIEYSLPKSGMVKLTVYDAMGREVAKLVNNTEEAGNHSYNFDASNLHSGIYFYTLETDGFKETKKMLLVK